MNGQGRTFLLLQVFFCFVVFASTTEETKKDCSQVKCPGPLTYYEDVGCTPVYKKEGDCCAYKYNCDHLNARSRDKCYFKHKSYEIDEMYGYDENNPCNVGCYCAKGTTAARFVCAVADCFSPPIGDGCYMKRNVSQCCSGPMICPENDSDVPKCIVDGTTYRDGEFFVPKNEPEKRCTCQKGYEGKNIEPFCMTPSTRCSTDLFYNEDIANKCAPIYNSDQNSATSCAEFWRCQNGNDTIISNPNKTASSEQVSSGEKDNLTCKFGNFTMNLGDEVSKGKVFHLACTKCVCEVPPTPTCRNYVNCDS